MSQEILPPILNDCETQFKISAGPGSGKTTWLVSHVQQLLLNSVRLSKAHKICCITYTRIGAEILLKRIQKNSMSNRIEVSTVHNFFYRNLIKPFGHLIVIEDGQTCLDTKLLKGHTEHRPSIDRINSWKKTLPKERLTDNLRWIDPLIKYLQKLDYEIDENSNVRLYSKTGFNDRLRENNLKLIEKDLFDYKKAYWRKGLIHHEDVLYLSYQLLSQHPRLSELLSAKYPYLFIDEFQDTSSLQSWLIKKLAKETTIVGVIGDPAQAIYEFAGAKRSDFINFSVEKIIDYTKIENYRSSTKIVDFLNTIRKDIQQKCFRKIKNPSKVTLLIGEDKEILDFLDNKHKNEYVILTRKRNDAKKLSQTQKKIQDKNLIEQLYKEDSNFKRILFIHSLFRSLDYHLNHKFKESINEISKHLNSSNLFGIEKRKLSIEILEYSILNQNNKLSDVYNNILSNYFKPNSVSGFSKIGKEKTSHKKPVTAFLPFLSSDVKRFEGVRTIHQSKGDEFDTVALMMFDNGTKKAFSTFYHSVLNFGQHLEKDNNYGEESRAYYVACSRARNNLYISFSLLSDEDETKIKGLDIDILRL